MNYIGNKKLLENNLTAFLSSDTEDEKLNAKSAKWAAEIKNDSTVTVLSGFQSHGERIVLEQILNGKANAVMLLARCLFTKCPPEYQNAVKEGRLLILSVTDNKEQFKVDYDSAFTRNMRVVSGGKKIVVGYVKKDGMLEKVLASSEKPFVLL